MDKLETTKKFISVISNLRDYKVMLLNKLKAHVKENLVYCENVSRETFEMFANLSKNEYLCFDTESCKDINNLDHERVYCWSLSNTIDDLVVYGYSLTQFIELMKSLQQYKEFKFDKKSKSKNVNVKMWVHNLGWDIEFFKYWFNDNDYKYYSKILYDDNSVEDEKLEGNSWNITENNGQVYNASINIEMSNLVYKKREYKSYIKIKMYDSAKVVPDKLETIGKKIINIETQFNKIGGEFDYEMIRPYDYELTEIEKCYIYNDVYILKEFVKQYYIENGLVGYTASSIAFNNMLSFCYPNASNKYEEFTKKYPEIKDVKINEMIDTSYTGGFTYCNPSIKSKIIIGDGHSIDINSSYPSAMMYKKLPYGQPKYFEGKYTFDKEYDIALQKVHFDGFKRKNNSNIGFIKIGSCCDFNQDVRKFGFKKNDYVANNFDEFGELITYNYNLVLTTFELEMLESVYDFYSYRKIGNKILKGKKNLINGIQYIEGVKFKSLIGDFGDFIDDCVLRKNKYKDEGNECGKTVAKRDMNSLYGKLGSGFYRKIMNYVVDDEGFFKYQRKYINDNEFDYLEERKYYRAFASFTTSYGRYKLQSVIIDIEKNYGTDKFLYCDTDSIYSLLSVQELENLGLDLDGKKLGAWDIEKEFVKFKCLGAKKYLIYGHEYGKKQKDKISPHCAGLPYEIQKQLNFDNFYLGAEFNKKQKHKKVGGYRLEWTTFKLQEFTFYR